LALALSVWLIGADRLFILALILVGSVGLAAVIAASALPIRAAKKRDMTGETRVLDGTRTVIRETKVLDGRAVTSPEVKLLQLPQQPTGGAWPELLRASYQAGLLGNGRAVPRQDLPEYDLTGGGNGNGAAEWNDNIGEWSGDITP
jgi:hypothetical protein